MVAPSGRSTPLGNGHRRDSVALAAPANTTSVKVVVRIRPDTAPARAGARFQKVVVQPINLTTLQIESTPAGGATSASAASALAKTGGKTNFTFDRVIGPDEGQPAVYEEAGSLVDSFLEGMNVTILAYGQTSSGKSYTMGTDRTSDADDELGEDRMGITPRAVAEIFERMREVTKETKGGTTFKAKLSYIEIYNEDLIDLLAGEHDARPTVQIREDKGTIIWSGLKEVTVSNAAEVMNLLTAGSSLRQTNATDMNAQSSRSHAIFSLTLEQKRYTGTGTPVAPPSPSNSRLQSRASMLPRVTSPTPGSTSRSSTPTSDRPGSRIGGLRPPSSMSGRASSPTGDDGAASGTDSWSTVTSKFHFVDLAGSERLKRTAAAGERVKEGISINSGLHALGNVISALGDPTKKTTHIPYRDSKLTRLLQDSLGGNARTMMVACISATELNLNETLSTVKYANRARNIKNRAEINEVEVGWDDVDYLQRTITKLRAEMAGLKGGDVSLGAISEESNRRSIVGGEGNESELQRKYAELTTELVTLKANASAAASTSLSREEFANAIEPVVEEYEKSLSALESQLSLTRAALGHSEEEIRELEARVEEEVRSNEASGSLIDELKARVSKLGEREATVEAYVRDLEAKLKDYGEQDESHGTAVSDLRKEITKNREQGEKTEQYIIDLEARLAKSDELNSTLRRQIDVLERDVQRREEAYQELEGRLSLLDTSGDHKQLLAEIDEKDRRVLDLERTLDELKSKTVVAEQEQERLEKLAAVEKEAREELQSRVRTLERASIMSVASRTRPDSVSSSQAPADGADSDPIDESTSLPTSSALTSSSADAVVVAALEHQLAKLQQSHDATLVELEAANVKYRNSLKEIEDLNAQVSDAKILNSEDGDSFSSAAPSPVPSSPRFERERGLGLGEDEEVEELASPTSPTSLSTPPPTMRTPRSRRSMPLAPQHRLSFLGRGQGAPAHTHARSASLSQELSLAVSQQASSPPNPRASSPSPGSLNRESIYSTLTASTGDRSYEQMKEEVMKLQSVLNEREAEITALESSLHKLRGTASTSPGLSPATPRIARNGNITPPMLSPLPPDADLSLSPKTRAAFDAFKADLSASGFPGSSDATQEDNAARLDDLMRAMAKKESAHREAVDELQEQLGSLRRQHDELTVLSRDQVVNMSSEISQLRSALEGRPEASHYEEKLKSMQDELEAKGGEVEALCQLAETDLSAATSKLAEEHQRALDSATAEHSANLVRLQEEHADALKRTIEERDATLKQKETEHANFLRAQATEHGEALQLRSADHDAALKAKADEMRSALNRKDDEHQAAIKRYEIERAALVSSEQEDVSESLEKLNAEHAAVFQAREADHSSAVDKLNADHVEQLASRDSTHAAALAQVREGHDVVLAETATHHTSVLDRLREEHLGALAALAATHSSALSSASTDFDSRIKEAQDSHEAGLVSLRKEHASTFTSRSAEHSTELEGAAQRHAAELEEKVTTLSAEHSKALEGLAAVHESTVKGIQEEHSTKLTSLVAEHEEAVKGLKEAHEASLATEREGHVTALKSLEEKHAVELNTLRQTLAEEHSSASALLAEQHVAAQRSVSDEHASAFDNLKAEHAQALSEQQTTHTSLLDGVTSSHQDELRKLEAERDETKKAHSELLVAHEALGSELTQAKESTTELQDTLNALNTVEKALLESQGERERLIQEVQQLKTAEGESTTKHETLTKDFDASRASVAKLEAELAQARQERDAFSTQLRRLSTGQQSLAMSNGTGPGSPDPNGVASPISESMTPERAMSPTNDIGRNSPGSRHDSRMLSNSGLPSGKPPPPTPPPSMPPPPTPTNLPALANGVRSVARSSSSSSAGRNSVAGPDTTPGTSIRSDSTTIDPRISKRFDDQEAQIARLTKQLTHCESDLQANIDLVNTLESALNDSERNLRKARTQMNDLAKERDAFLGQNDALRQQIQDAHTEVETVRHSVIEVESRLQEERYGKERAKQELERRLDEVQKRKSKFACF